MTGRGRPAPAQDAALGKWKTAFLVAFGLGWLVRGLDWLLDLPDALRIGLQVPLLLVAVLSGVVIILSWIIRQAARRDGQAGADLDAPARDEHR